MTVVPPGSLVLVTGANGFIAMWIIRLLLENGYRVRGTVRSSDKIAHIKKTFEEYGDRVEIVVVEDMVKEGAFDEAVKGVSAIHHVATPMSPKAITGPNDLLDPAIKGTTGIFESVLKCGTEVKSIVVTSSVAAIANAEDKGIVDETRWNTNSMERAANLPTDVPWYMHARDLYASAKANAEKAAWEISKKDGVKWQLSTICPSVVLGPVIQECPTATDLNTTVKSFYDVIFDNLPKEQTFLTDLNWVDVRDVALAHVLAMEKVEAAGQRFLVSQGWTNWDYWFDLKAGLKPAIPTPGPDVMVCDSSKIKKVFGFKFRDPSTSFNDFKEDITARGWIA